MRMSADRAAEFAQTLDNIRARLAASRLYDPENAHDDATNVLLDALDHAAPEVADAYRRLVDSAEWWSS